MSESVSAESLRQRLRELPAVDQLARRLAGTCSDTEAVSVARAVLDSRRIELLAGATDDPDLTERMRARLTPSLRRVLNATGVLIHTNLGRAPLSPAAVEALMRTATGYANVEFDLEAAGRRSRHAHVSALLAELTGAQDAMVVNNGAAAVMLAVAALAAGRAVIVSRGQLVEIGGGFRIPEILAQAGVPLVEVGTTNRTRLADYAMALEANQTSMILRVHPSNFRTIGFVQDVAIESLCGLGVPVIDDVGAGVLIDGLQELGDEPSVRRSIAAGAAVVCFSGDKLLGGPQAGLLVGRADAIAACESHPLARALRIGRLPLAALQATLALYRDPGRALREIPVLSMLAIPRDVLESRASRLADAVGGTVVESVARVGGGAMPLLELAGPAVRVDGGARSAASLSNALRACDPPLVARIADGVVLLDPRTLAEDELDQAAGVVLAVART